MKTLLLILLGLAAPVGLGLTIRALAFGTDGFELERMLDQPGKLVEPAPLTRAHRTDPECRECAACHALTRAVPSEKCLACHEEIERRTADAVGHHGRDLQGECVTCHTDHAEQIIEFDPEQFNHLRAAFTLQGRHLTLECDQCHLTPDGNRYLGLGFASCKDCHEDPHLGTLAPRECAACHGADDWGQLNSAFHHDTDTAFPIDRLHGEVACDACHPTPVYDSTPRSCAECHADFAGFLEGRIGNGELWPADAHSGLVTCEQCHPGDQRAPTPEAHARLCASCHTERYANLYLNRAAHLAGLASKVGTERMELLERVGSHNYVEAERRARALAEQREGF